MNWRDDHHDEMNLKLYLAILQLVATLCKVLVVFGNFLTVYLVFGKIVILQTVYAVGQKLIAVKGQILKELSSHRVTLAS